MNILQVCEYYQHLGGTENYIINLSECLEQLGHTVGAMYGIKTNGTLSHGNRNEYFLPAITNRKGVLDTRTEKIIEDIILKNNPDVAYVHNVANYSIVKKLAELMPTIRFIHDHRLFCPKGDKMFIWGGNTCGCSCGINCFLNSYGKGCLIPLPNVVLSKIKHTSHAIKIHKQIRIIVASQYMKDCLLYNGFSSSLIETVPYFCSFSKSVESEFGEFAFFAGRLIPHKGVQYLIKSIPFWPEKLRLVVAGDGPYLKSIKSLAKKMGIAYKVDFLGEISNAEMQQYYERCLLVTVPSVWDEPFGIVGLEAMFCGKPIVAFNVGGISDWLYDGINGFLIKRKDTRALAEKISVLFRNKDLARQMGKEGKEIYKKRFVKEKHITRLISIFNDEIQGKSFGSKRPSIECIDQPEAR